MRLKLHPIKQTYRTASGSDRDQSATAGADGSPGANFIHTMSLYPARYCSRFCNWGRAYAVKLATLFLALFFLSTIATAQTPQVTKVEPPGWWTNHSINPVRVLIRGQNLKGATVLALPGLIAGPPKVNAAGTYMFV